MVVEYLTELEQDILDPTGNCRNLIKRIPNHDTWENLPSHVTNGEEFLQVTCANLKRLSQAHKPYTEYATEMIDKCGRQGGMFNRKEWESTIHQYFSDREVDIHPWLYEARDLFIKEIKEKIDQVGRPQLELPSIIPTFAGIPSGLRKGSFAAETLSVNRVSLQRFLPTIPGQRRMRGKNRVIFMDATANVRAQERYLTGARKWFRKHFPQYFGSWLRDDVVVRPGITRAVDQRCAFANIDYKQMDINFRKKITMELILPIYEVLFPDLALTIGAHFEQNHEQDVYMGDYLLRGIHSILSGANITNDFETIYSVLLMIAISLHLGIRPVFFTALGDDVTAAFRDVSMAKRYLRHAIEVSNHTSMEIHPDKSSVSLGYTTYCRKTYYQAGKRDLNGVLYGAYPSVLAVNNIVQPESIANTAGEAVRSDLQRLDGLMGSPDSTFVIQQYVKYTRSALTEVLATDDWYACGEDWRDWWFRVYDERWAPNTSWSLTQVIMNLPVSTAEKKLLLRSLNITG